MMKKNDGALKSPDRRVKEKQVELDREAREFLDQCKPVDPMKRLQDELMQRSTG